MASSFATYDPAEVVITLGGIPITGYAEDTFVNVEFDEDQWTKVTGADGHTARAKSNNYAGSVTITLMQTSAGNDVLNSLWLRDRRRNEGVVPLLVKDSQGRTRWTATYAWVRKMPAQEFGSENGEREWVIDCAELLGSLGGNQVVEA